MLKVVTCYSPISLNCLDLHCVCLPVTSPHLQNIHPSRLLETIMSLVFTVVTWFNEWFAKMRGRLPDVLCLPSSSSSLSSSSLSPPPPPPPPPSSSSSSSSSSASSSSSSSCPWLSHMMYCCSVWNGSVTHVSSASRGRSQRVFRATTACC